MKPLSILAIIYGIGAIIAITVGILCNEKYNYNNKFNINHYYDIILNIRKA